MSAHDCTHLAEDLVAYADGELEPARAQEVELELEACATCRLELDALQRSWVALDALTEGDLQPASAARLEALEAQIRAEAGAAAPAKAGLLVRFPWLGPVVAAAGVLLVAGLSWSVLRAPAELTAVRPNKPAPSVPRTEGPEIDLDQRPDAPVGTPTTPGQRDTVPDAPDEPLQQPDEVAPQPDAPDEPLPQPPAPDEVAPQPDSDPQVDETGPVIAASDFESLSPEDQELVENLELALLLGEAELSELTAEELEAELLLQDVHDELEGWDPDELEAG